MEPYENYTRDIVAGMRGKTTGAFFDFDGTIIATHSVKDMFLERIRSGEITGQEIYDLGDLISRYFLRFGDFEDAIAAAVRNLKGMSELRLRSMGEKVSREHLTGEVFPEIRAVIKAHQRKGHTVAIVSSATRYQVESLASELGIEHILCTELEFKNGKLTGRLDGKACYGENKLTAVREFAKNRRVSLKKSYFYSNGSEDIVAMEAVGHPVAVNPDSKLASIARESGWREIHLNSRGMVGVGDVVRSLFIYGSVLPFLAAGLPIRALGVSERDATNFSLSAWSSVASAIARLRLIVNGEEHIWSHRPAVFVFNHQSSIDVLITAKLLREDIVGVAKKELKYQLPMGPAFTYAGAVFIDREHVGDPEQALKPAIDALHSGRSVVIAPEGTRSQNGNLKQFKFGAFHLAQQAGVPIVPIIIHNAQDALPYKSLFVRPAQVQVTVLKPIHTDNWKTREVESKVREIRSRYLDVLGQSDEHEHASVA